MLPKSASGSNDFRVEGSRREALGHFLRERRAEIAPDAVGIASRRGRRTPGLRREEVAFLADIGVKWYARLEAGDEVHPSAATLTGIAFALRLSSAELEYILELAGLKQPLASTAEVDVTIPRQISALVTSIHGVAATICDRINRAGMEYVSRCAFWLLSLQVSGRAQYVGPEPARSRDRRVAWYGTRSHRVPGRGNVAAQFLVPTPKSIRGARL